MLYDTRGGSVAKPQVTVRLDKDQLVRERKALRVRTVAEPIERALTLPTEKATPPDVLRRRLGARRDDARDLPGHLVAAKR